MADMEKVIAQLESMRDYHRSVGNNITADIANDAIAMLKEQEAVPVVRREIAHMFFWCCGSCGVAITDGDKFCRNCGKAVKWNGGNDL